MQCTKCSKILDISNFRFKNIEQKIYYLHCNICRERISKKEPYKKERERKQYEEVKQTNIVHCECGKCFIGFRQYHYARHLNSKKHQNYMTSKNH